MRLSPQLFIAAANTLVGLGDHPADRAEARAKRREAIMELKRL